MDDATFDEITDCLAWKLIYDPDFHMRGRTISSMTKMTREWHREMQVANLRQLTEWPGLQIQPWRFEARESVWEAVELRTNIELLQEGRKQKHCVFAYVPKCTGGKSAIFSLRQYDRAESTEAVRLTIEVDEKRVIHEIAGYRNRRPTDEELKIIRRWANDKGLRINTRS